jgi:hypothetical protein
MGHPAMYQKYVALHFNKSSNAIFSFQSLSWHHPFSEGKHALAQGLRTMPEDAL